METSHSVSDAMLMDYMHACYLAFANIYVMIEIMFGHSEGTFPTLGSNCPIHALENEPIRVL